MNKKFLNAEKAVWRLAGGRFVEKNHALYGDQIEKYSWVTLIPEQYRPRVLQVAMSRYDESFPITRNQYLEFLAEKWVKRLMLLETVMATEDFTPTLSIDEPITDGRQFIALTVNGSLIAAGIPDIITGNRMAIHQKLIGSDYGTGREKGAIAGKNRRFTTVSVGERIEVDEDTRFSSAVAIFTSPSDEPHGLDLLAFSQHMRDQFFEITEGLYDQYEATQPS